MPMTTTPATTDTPTLAQQWPRVRDRMPSRIYQAIERGTGRSLYWQALPWPLFLRMVATGAHQLRMIANVGDTGLQQLREGLASEIARWGSARLTAVEGPLQDAADANEQGQIAPLTPFEADALFEAASCTKPADAARWQAWADETRARYVLLMQAIRGDAKLAMWPDGEVVALPGAPERPAADLHFDRLP